MRATALAALAALALASAPRAARAHAPDTYGFGARPTALGGAVTADATDFSAVYYNPAGLVGAPGPSLAVGYQYSKNDLYLNDGDAKVPSVRGLAGGIVVPGRLFGLPVAFGVATYLPDTGLSTIRALKQETPRWELYDDRLSITFIAAGIAVRPVSFLEIGGGVGFLAATRGRFGIRGTADISAPYLSQLEHEVDADLTSVRYPIVGVRFHVPNPDKRSGYKSLLSVGATYRGQAQLPLQLDALLKGNVNALGVDVPLTYALSSSTIDGFIPQQLAIGLSGLVTTGPSKPRFRASLDVVWMGWSGYASPAAKTSALLDIDLPKGLPVEIPQSPKSNDPVPPGFSDTFVPRIGLELTLPFGPSRRVFGESHGLFELPLRAGFVGESSPVPEQRGLTNYADTNRFTVTFGTGAHLFDPVSVLRGALVFDLVGQVSVLPSREMRKTSPSDFVGDYEAHGLMWGMGATLGLIFDGAR